jgi:hypothetical protein
LEKDHQGKRGDVEEGLGEGSVSLSSLSLIKHMLKTRGEEVEIRVYSYIVHPKRVSLSLSLFIA